MRMQLFSRLIAPCVMFVLLIFSGHQGYVVFKNYNKVTNKLNNRKINVRKNDEKEKSFALFQPAVWQRNTPAAVKSPLSAEIEGIVSSDEKWLSFAVIKMPAGQQSYREGESLVGVSDACIEEINNDNVVVNYEGTTQVLALKKPDYFRGGVESGPLQKPTNDAGAESLHLNDVLVLKPFIEKGRLEGYEINPRNASSFFQNSGLEKGDVVVKVNSTDMTKEEQAKSIIAGWSKMKEAAVVVRRHAHLENIQVNVLNN